MVHLRDIKGCTYWAAYDYIDGRWKRAAVYKLEGRSDNGLIVYFKNIKTRGEHKRGAGYLQMESFRPFAIDGGKRR
jgi:hypothetical protein